MQLPPSSSLSHIVKHYLIVEYDKDIRLNYRLFSDGNPGIVFHFKNPLIPYTDGHPTGSVQPHSFIYGQITQYNDLRSSGKLGMLVVVLQPYGIYTLLNIAAHELNDCIIRSGDLFGREASDLEDQILGEQDVCRIIQSVERFLEKRSASVHSPDPFLLTALDLIYKHRGIITIDELLKKIPVTERQLERKFKEHIGISPKKFTGIIKFQNFLKLLQNHPPGEKISDAIYDGGYYDQPHLNNYFKKATGVTPLQYRSDHHLLAVNFMQLSPDA